MDQERLNHLLRAVAEGNTSVQEASDVIKKLPFEDIDFAHIDHHRSLRKGFPEVIFGQGKTASQIIGIIQRMLPQESVILVTRVDAAKADKITRSFAEAVYDPEAGMILFGKKKRPPKGRGNILVIAAGTSDIPVAKEAHLTAEAMGNRVKSIYDVGVAGIHRPVCPSGTSSKKPPFSSSWPAWKEPCRAWWPEWFVVRSSPYPPVSATAPVWGGSPPCLPC